MWCNFKYSSSFHYRKASFVLQFFHIYASFWVLFPRPTVNHFSKKGKACGCPKSNETLVKTYATVSASNFLILPLLTTIHSFLYVHIRFRTFRIAIKPNWNNYYNISNVPTTLYLSQMKRISSWQYFLDLFTNPTNGTISYFGVHSMWMEVSFLLGASACICKENL